MDLDVFFKHCDNKEFSAVADEALEILTHPIAQKDLKQYNFLDHTLSFLAYWEYYKEYDILIRLNEGLKQHNPSLYQEVGAFVNSSLIGYHCFKGEKSEVIEACLHGVYTPDDELDIDLLISSLWQCVYYGYTEVVDSFIEREYKNLLDNDYADEESLKDMALIKLNIELAKANTARVDKSKFVEQLSQYSFNFNQDIVALMYKGLDLTVNDDLKTKVLGKFKAVRRNEMITLKSVFMQYMLDKNCSFAISGTLWENFTEYWENKNASSWLNYFSFKERSFTSFLDNNGLFMPNKAYQDVILIWGAGYILEFIESLRLEQSAYYAPQKKMIAKLKQQFKNSDKVGLWQYSFVHQWAPVNELFTQEYETEKQLFLTSYDEMPEELHPDDFEGQEAMVGSLMEMMNDMMGGEDDGEDFGSEDDDETFFDDPFGMEKNTPQRAVRQPVQKAQTFRRNDKVTAKYSDGTVKKNVKYKTVQADHEKGLCVIEA